MKKKMTTTTTNAKMKSEFRKTKEWKQFRIEKREAQNGKDPITGKRLSKGAPLHHMDLNPEHYTDISNSFNFVMLNSTTHEMLHRLYLIYRKDPEVIERLKDYLDQMVELNKGE